MLPVLADLFLSVLFSEFAAQFSKKQTRSKEKFSKKQKFGEKNSDDFAEAPSEVPG